MAETKQDTVQKSDDIRDARGRFVPGNPGNPNAPGRPSRKPFLEKLQEILPPHEAAEIAAAHIRGGNADLIKQYWQQNDGLPKAETDTNATVTIRVEDESPDA